VVVGHPRFHRRVILLLIGRPPKWEHNKVAEIKQAKEKAGNAEQTLQEVRKKHVT